MKKLLLLLSIILFFKNTDAQCPQYLNIDTNVCGSGCVTANATILRSRLCGDSLVIIYNATQGTTGLVGASKVYMHSGPEFVPFTGWQTAYTKGHYGLDDGVGKMDSIGPNLWRIVINPRTYYNYPAGNCLNAIFMVFRNANGSATGKDNTNQDIVLVTSGNTITSTFSGISATRKYAPITYLWSDAHTDSVRTICSSSNVNLSVVATSGGCSDTGTVKMRVGGVKINLGADVVRCNPTQTNVFTAPTGYTGYYWFDGNTSSNIYTAYNNGEYRIRAVDSANCVSRDTIKLFDANNYYLSVPDAAIPCAGSSVTLDASVNIQKNGDSLTIIYDATQGVTGLVGAAKVYFHSGPEFHAFSGWQLGYTVGNFNLDDGIGQMKSLGNNRWSITIHPQTYYNYPVDSSLNGIFMVFRNFDGTQTGKDWANNNVFVLTATVPPSSQFTGVTAQHKARANVTYNWSTSATTAAITTSTAGIYYVTATQGSCIKKDTIVVTVSNGVSLNIGNDTTLCPGATDTVRAGNFASYIWSTTSTASKIAVSTPNTYSVTVTDANGCTGSDSKIISYSNVHVNLGADVNRCSNNQTTTLNAGSNFKFYKWFDGPNTTTHTYIAAHEGRYWLQAIDSFGCTSRDTVYVNTADVANISVANDTLLCSGDTVTLNAGVNIQQNGDSVVITYNATQGVSGLTGAAKVYMHSGAELVQFGGWQYTTGNFGQDDGIGKMDSLGNNRWRITIHPQTYYGYPADSSLRGIFMIFRNANGSQTGKNNSNQDIYVAFSTSPPTSAFTGVQVAKKAKGNISYTWSTLATTSSVNILTPGTFIVTATDGTCSKADTITVVQNPTTLINLGNDTTICAGAHLVLNAGTGFTSYHWSTGDSATASIFVSAAASFGVTVTNSSGCVLTGDIGVTLNGKKVELGADIIRCSPTQVIPLNAHKGFLHYEWNGIANQDSVWFASNAGKYWIKCIDSINCLSFDTVSVINSEVHHLSLPDSSLACTGATVALDAATTFTNYGDSITITYDATKGTTGLVGAPKVYMHSGAELHPFGGWQYTTGNFGQDDGVGLMKNLGNNIWTITIQPQGYYGYHPDSTLNGILMIFRNANGTLTGKDGTNQDIFLLTAGGALTSTFNGITASHKHYGTLTYNWSNSSTNGNIGATTGGNYSVTVSDASCSASDTAHVFFGTNPIIHLGNDTIVCGGNQFHLNVDSGYVSYLWSTGASTSTISVATTNNYSVSVTTIFGCVGKDTIHVTALPIPNALFTVQQIGTTNSVTINSTTTTNADSLFWNFGDSNTSDTSGIFVYPYSTTNTYTVTLIAVNDCGRDTTTHTITLVPNGISETDLNSISIYPNPAKDKLFISASSISDNAFVTINNMLGEEIKTMKWNATSIQSVDVSKFTNGIYMLQITDNDKKKTFKFNIIH